MGWESMYWIHLAKDTDQWPAVLNKLIQYLGL